MHFIVMQPILEVRIVRSMHIGDLLCNFSAAAADSKNTLMSCWPQMCHGQKSHFVGDKLIPPLMTESLYIMGIFSPLRTWVDDFIDDYMAHVMGVDRLDPIAQMFVSDDTNSWTTSGTKK